MSYYLKKSNTKKGVYLQIYEGKHDPDKKYTVSKSYKVIGYVHELIENGIEDPINHFKKEVDKLNQIRIENQVKEIEDNPIKNIGHLLIKSLLSKLDIQEHFKYLTFNESFRFDLYSLTEALIYSRIVSPCSKFKTFNEVIPSLYSKYDFSLSQLYEGLNFLGYNYDRVIEILNLKMGKLYRIITGITYFDCTNFYFEIDREDKLRRKGPSKENRNDPIVSMGLLLDSNQIPIGMKLFPGNESEKPVIREIISELKSNGNIKGRTIQVADKGLNCSKNIIEAIKQGDGYIFSQSVKMLPNKEKTWVLLDNDYEIIMENGEVIYKLKSCIDEFDYIYEDDNGKKIKIKLKQKRIATWNKSLADKKQYEISKMVERIKTLNYSRAKRSEYGDASKYVNFISVDDNGEIKDDNIIPSLNYEKIEEDIKLAGYNVIITSELNMDKQAIYDTYHNLWRIEESFRIMKGELEARPVYVQTENMIYGHFLICYISVVLLRLLQFKVFKNAFKSNDILKFIRETKCIKVDDTFINVTSKSDSILAINNELKLNLKNYILRQQDIDKLSKCL